MEIRFHDWEKDPAEYQFAAGDVLRGKVSFTGNAAARYDALGVEQSTKLSGALSPSVHPGNIHYFAENITVARGETKTYDLE